MEVDTDGDILQRERCIAFLWPEGKVTIECASPQNAALGELNGLLASDDLAFGDIRAVERERYFVGSDDANADARFFLNRELGVEHGALLGLTALQVSDDLLQLVMCQRYLL